MVIPLSERKNILNKNSEMCSNITVSLVSKIKAGNWREVCSQQREYVLPRERIQYFLAFFGRVKDKTNRERERFSVKKVFPAGGTLSGSSPLPRLVSRPEMLWPGFSNLSRFTGYFALIHPSQLKFCVLYRLNRIFEYVWWSIYLLLTPCKQ